MEPTRKEKILRTMVVSEKHIEHIKTTFQPTAGRSDCPEWNGTLRSRYFFSPTPMFGAATKLRKASSIESGLVFIVQPDFALLGRFPTRLNFLNIFSVLSAPL